MGFGLGVVLGSALAMVGAVLMSAPRAVHVRRALARWVLRREPHVEFEVLQQ
jgi:hypothetical protein